MGSGYSVPSSVEGFSAIAERRRRVRRTKSTSKPARMRSPADRLGGSLPGAIHDQKLVFQEKRLRDQGTDATRSDQPGQRGPMACAGLRGPKVA
jgi:hypothetical protein